MEAADVNASTTSRVILTCAEAECAIWAIAPDTRWYVGGSGRAQSDIIVVLEGQAEAAMDRSRRTLSAEDAIYAPPRAQLMLSTSASAGTKLLRISIVPRQIVLPSTSGFVEG